MSTMSEKRDGKKITVLDMVLTVLGLALGGGVKLVFHACTALTDSGAHMSCFWAEQAVMGLGGVIAVQAVLILIFKEKARLGLSLAMIPTALLAVAIPGGLINLCMMTDMRCHSVMRPAVAILGVVIMLAACGNAVLEWRRMR